MPKLAMVNWPGECGFYMPRTVAKLPSHHFVVRADTHEGPGMNATSLSDPVDPTDALFLAEGSPRNFEVHDEAAAMMEVQSFAGGVGCEEQRGLSFVEPSNHVSAFMK
jgi:hypothetical protein